MMSGLELFYMDSEWCGTLDFDSLPRSDLLVSFVLIYLFVQE